MKRIMVITTAAVLMVMMLVSCSRKAGMTAISEDIEAYNRGEADYAVNYSAGAGTTAPSAAPPPMPDIAPEEYYEKVEEQMAIGGGFVKPTEPVMPQAGNGLDEKIIYTANAEIETVDFDRTIETVYTMMETYGAFVENSNVAGKNYSQEYYGYTAYRTARFTLRVPKDDLQNMARGLDALGNVIALQNSAQNITSQYVDTQSRLAASRVEETRLLEMLGKAETIADMIVIEARLSELRYQIESMTSSLNNWQNQIDYSTLTLNIYEVEKITEAVPIQRTYWMQVSDGLIGTLRGVGIFFMGLLKWLIVSMPIIILLVIIAVVMLFTIRTRLKKRKQKEPEEKTDDKKI